MYPFTQVKNSFQSSTYSLITGRLLKSHSAVNFTFVLLRDFNVVKKQYHMVMCVVMLNAPNSFAYIGNAIVNYAYLSLKILRHVNKNISI